MAQEGAAASFAALDERRRGQAVARFAVLRPCLEEGVALARAAAHAGVPVRTAERWLARYRQGGLVGLARPARRDAGARRLPADLVALVEFFAARAPEVAEAANAAERKRRIEALERAPDGSRDRLLFLEWETAKRVSEAVTGFVRVPGEEGGRFPTDRARRREH